MKALLLRLARLPITGIIIGRIFAHMSFLIPVERLRETKTLIAFHHPSPSYPVHILLAPKRIISSLAQLSPEDGDFLIDLFACVHDLASEFGVEETGYRLIVNGGKNQEVAHLHFHLVSEKAD